MTRWSERDLAGRILEAYGEDVELVTYQAQDAKGKMLDDRILSAKDYEFLKQEMNVDIVEANYNQKPIDITGRLYNHFMEWEKLPTADKVYNYTDTADTGTDYLCSVNYVVYNKEAYITGLVFTDEPMEVTEKQVAELLHYGNVNEANIESNNGGRGFARNVETLLKTDYNSNRCVIRATPQTHNKESRILASSAWVANHIFMPTSWQKRYPEFCRQIYSYQRKGKNAHDDAVDVLAAIYEFITGEREPEVIDKHYPSALARRRGSYYWIR
jgi:predicted phage terminase large subunit-like protein